MPTLPTCMCNLLSSLVPCILTRRWEIRFPPKPGHCGQCSSWSGVTVGTVVVPALVVFASAGSSRAQGSISGPSYGAFNAEIHWDEKTKRCKARKVPQGARGTAMPGKKQGRSASSDPCRFARQFCSIVIEMCLKLGFWQSRSVSGTFRRGRKA